MSLEATIAENTAALRELIAKLSTGAIIPQDAETDKPAATTTEATGTTKKGAAQSSAKTQPASSSSATSSAESTTDTGPAPTYEDVKAAILHLSKEKGREAAVAALQRFGVTKLPDVLPRSFGDLIKYVDDVIAGAEA